MSYNSELAGPVSLPNGTYPGVWSGYFATVSYQGKEYKIKTKMGCRGTVDCEVEVTEKGGGIKYPSKKSPLDRYKK